MPDDLDLSEFPDFDVPSSLAAEVESGNLDTGLQLFQAEFCLLFNGRPWQTVAFASPSPEAALLTMTQWVNRVGNPTLVRMGYPPNMLTFNIGRC
jgi:hypothetical protein